MIFSYFPEVTKGLLGNPYQLPKVSTVLHEFTSLLQQQISKAIRPLDWIQMHPKSVPSSFLGASILQQELTMETAGSPDNHIVGANGIPREV
jgi:hypothetical protein